MENQLGRYYTTHLINCHRHHKDSHTRKLEELETDTYIVSQFSLDDWYEKVAKEIIRYVIRKLHVGVQLVCEIRTRKLCNMSLDTNTKQEKNMDGKLAVDEEEYELQVLEW